ncbi:MAG TPA: lysophospholipid acyltransferase family protein [Candidatus Krumholzibacteria bacterium]|nr:lysophospholipid acyltransferase family protein [Candidatus Krumholzibacteria bacterium]
MLWLTVVPVSDLAPRKREPLLRFWARTLRDATLVLMRGAGARFEIGLRVPCEGGILILMNHQSVVDIPVCYRFVPDAYPQMVAHHRYWRGIPLISHMMRAYRHIPVYPGRTGRAELDRLAGLAREADHPIVVFPEGHRTRDGEIRPWKRAGLQAFLSARPWTVHVVVIDGLWNSARIPDFIRTIARVHCRTEAIAPFSYDGRGRDNHDEFIDRLEQAMCDKLAEMRRKTHATEHREHESAGSAVSS